MKVSCKKIELTLELIDADRVTVPERVLLVLPDNAVIAENQQFSTEQGARDGIYTKTSTGIKNSVLCKPAQTHPLTVRISCGAECRAVLVCSRSYLFRKKTPNIRPNQQTHQRDHGITCYTP